MMSVYQLICITLDDCRSMIWELTLLKTHCGHVQLRSENKWQSRTRAFMVLWNTDNHDASVKPLWGAQRSEQTQVSLQTSPHQDDLWGRRQPEPRKTDWPETAKDAVDGHAVRSGLKSKIQGSPLSRNFRKGFSGDKKNPISYSNGKGWE